MNVAEIKQELTRLTDAERFELAMCFWDSIENKDEIESPAWQEKSSRNVQRRSTRVKQSS